VQGKADEVADEQQLPSQKTPRAETPQVGAQRQNQGNDDQGGDAVIADSDPKGQGRDYRNGYEQERDHLTLGRGIVHTHAGDQPDDGTEQHGDGQEIVIGHCHLGCRCHRGGGPALDLQRPGQVHEGPFGGQPNGDGHHALGGTPQPVEARIGADEEIDPSVSDALGGAGRGCQGRPGRPDVRDAHRPIVASI
jgi:hypothetical protein